MALLLEMSQVKVDMSDHQGDRARMNLAPTDADERFLRLMLIGRNELRYPHSIVKLHHCTRLGTAFNS